MTDDIFSIATSLDRQTVEEIIELATLDRLTSANVLRAVVPGYGSELTFLSSSDFNKAKEAAVNLPEKNLQGVLETLSNEQLRELLALMWMGRGDASGPVPAVFQCLKEHAGKVSGLDIRYIMSKPLDRYLQQVLHLNASDVLIDYGDFVMPA